MTRERAFLFAWWTSRFFIPIAVLVTATILLERSGFDRAAVELFFDSESGTFPFRDSWFFDGVLHTGVEALLICGTTTLVVGAAIGWTNARWAEAARRCAYLATCLFLTVAIASIWRYLADPRTLWDALGFRGEAPSTASSAGSFWETLGTPGTDAAFGFAFMALYFVGASIQTHRRWLWLAPGLLLGTLVAAGQCVRGAQFPSRELLSIPIAWFAAGTTAALFRSFGWLNWSESKCADSSALPSDPWTERSLPWLVGSILSLAGIGFYTIDQVTHELEDRYPRVHGTVEVLELVGMALGLGFGSWLLVERIAALRDRSARRVEEERERRFQILGRMAASVAHEVRNPLQTMRLIVDEQRIDVPQLRVHPLRPAFEASFERINRAVELVYRLARPEGIDADHTELGVAARESIASLERLDPGRARFEWLAAPPPAVVRASPSDVRIVFDNLLRNASEASPAGGSIVLELLPSNANWAFRIRNHGSLEAKHDVNAAGLGLGVSISRQIVGNAGGTIEFSEGDGQVTCTVSLPRDSEVAT